MRSKVEVQLLLQERSMALKEVSSRFNSLFDNSPLSIQILDRSGKTVLVNRAWKKLWDLNDEYVENFVLKEYNVFTDSLLAQKNLLGYFERALQGEVVQMPKVYYDPMVNGKEGRMRIVRPLICPVLSEEGHFNELVLIHEDITEQFVEVENKQFLAGLGAILMESLDYITTLEQIALACIPFFSDAAMVDIIEDGEIKRLVTKHQDKTVEKRLMELVTTFPPKLDSPQPTPRAIRTGKPELLAKVDREIICRHTYNEEHANLISSTGLKSHLVTPLIIRGEIIGTLNFWITSARRPFDEKDIHVAEAICRFAALAIDNARHYRDAQNAISQREDFISIASHELKTPITALMLQMEIAQTIIKTDEKPDRETLQKIFDSATRQVERLSSLIEDMLDLTRISRKSLVSENKKQVLFREMIEDVLERFSSQFKSRGIEVDFYPLDDVYVDCDPLRLEQVITNVISNAILYGQNRPLEVSMQVKDGMAICQIKDNGIGIAKQNLDKIFDRFERIHSATDGKGLGLGLYICRQIMEELSGRIYAESAIGIGSAFFIELPRS